MNTPSSDHPPLVSIGMPVFNDFRFIPDAIDSLLQQSWQDFELIISDDASTDGSDQICQEYASRNARIRYFRQSSNLGIQRNMEFLLEQARGVFFMWAGDDDQWHPDFIRNLLVPLMHDPDLVLSFCPYSSIDEEGSPIQDMGIIAFDYSGKFALLRLLKFIFFYDDGCGYGLFRKQKIETVRYPIWWGINRKTAINNIYPVIAYFLTVGNFCLVGPEVLWFNRKKARSHRDDLKKPKNFLAFFIRKINLCYESFRSVYRGSKSILLVVGVAPFLLLRMVYDILAPIVHFLGKALFSKFRSLKNGKTQRVDR